MQLFRWSFLFRRQCASICPKVRELKKVIIFIATISPTGLSGIKISLDIDTAMTLVSTNLFILYIPIGSNMGFTPHSLLYSTES